MVCQDIRLDCNIGTIDKTAKLLTYATVMLMNGDEL